MDLIGISKQGRNLLGYSVELDGSAEWINHGDVLAVERTDQRTWMFYAYRTSAVGSYVVCRMGPGPSFGYGVICNSSGTIALDLLNTPTTNELLVTTVGTVPLNAWTHVAVTYAGTSAPSGVAIYFNGVAQTLTTDVDTLTSTLLGGFPSYTIGAHNSSGVAPFAGKLSSVAQYSTALTATQVMACGGNRTWPNLIQVGPAANLVHWLKVTANDTTSAIADASTSGFNGTPSNLESGDFQPINRADL